MIAPAATVAETEQPPPGERWTGPPDQPSLGRDDLHVWYIESLAQVSAAEEASLSPDERATAGRFHFLPDRVRYAACRSKLRSILAKYLDKSPERLRFELGPYGKPFLSREHGSALRFNVSHSNDSGMIAMAVGREVGIDIERLDKTCEPEPMAMARRYLTSGEAAFVSRASIDNRRTAFLRCWTLKEAWMKATGVGLTEPLDRFDVSAAIESVRPVPMRSEITGTLWTLHSLPLAPSCIAAVAAEGSWKRLHCWTAI